MKVPVTPFLGSLILLEVVVCASIANTAFAWLGIPATVNAAYSTYREVWHNGRPLVVWRRK